MLGAECFTIDHVAPERRNCVEAMQDFLGFAERGGQKGQIPLGQIQPFRHIFGQIGEEVRRQQIGNGFISAMQRRDIGNRQVDLAKEKPVIDTDIMRIDQLDAILT